MKTTDATDAKLKRDNSETVEANAGNALEAVRQMYLLPHVIVDERDGFLERRALG